jgi:hypothetical protein
MATNVDSAFDILIDGMTPSPRETATAASHRQSVYSKLNDSLGVSTFFRTGSTGNSTGVRYWSDVDYFAGIPYSQQRDSSSYMLQVVRDKLQERFYSTDIRVSTPAVVCNFGIDGAERVEVVPAYYVGLENGNEIYKIPLLGGGWIRSSPKVHNEFVSYHNKRLDFKLKQLIRLVKAIKYYNEIPVSSFYLELRIAKWAMNEKSIIYRYDVTAMLRHLVTCDLAQLIDPTGISGYVPGCSTQNQKVLAVSRLNSALNRAVKALQYENDGYTRLAFEEWDKVFNGRFPSYG